jgi:hypothetical protein
VSGRSPGLHLLLGTSARPVAQLLQGHLNGSRHWRTINGTTRIRTKALGVEEWRSVGHRGGRSIGAMIGLVFSESGLWYGICQDVARRSIRRNP